MSDALTKKYSVSMPEDLAATIRERTGAGGFSAFITAAARRQLEHDRLSELVDDYESRHGAFSSAELEAAASLLRGGIDPDLDRAA